MINMSIKYAGSGNGVPLILSQEEKNLNVGLQRCLFPDGWFCR